MDLLKTSYLNGPHGQSLGELKLKGRVIRVKSLSVHMTYHFSGLISGIPTDRINKDIVNSVLEFVKNFSIPEVKTLVAKYKMKVQKGPKGIKFSTLPLYFLIVDLESDAAKGSSEMFSSVRLLAFSEEVSFENLEAQLKKALKNVDWNKVAVNWSP